MIVEIPEWVLPLLLGIGLGFFLSITINAEIIGMIREGIESVLLALINWVKRRRFMLEYYGDLAREAERRKRGGL